MLYNFQQKMGSPSCCVFRGHYKNVGLPTVFNNGLKEIPKWPLCNSVILKTIGTLLIDSPAFILLFGRG